ncbi:MAG: TIGR03643 family protein [Deltaproteobacteria bacterium]|nr:TIGR03643 family protein [Deltaproteobacteria bacterium]
MTRKEKRPVTKTKNPEPSQYDPDWVIWAAWADRVTFEEIEEKTGLREHEVITVMRRSLKRSSFKRWRKRVHQVSIKNRKIFEQKRQAMKRGYRLDETWDDE